MKIELFCEETPKACEVYNLKLHKHNMIWHFQYIETYIWISRRRLYGASQNKNPFYVISFNFFRVVHVSIWNALRDLVPFAQFKKREKHSRRSVSFIKTNIPSWVFFKSFKFYKWYQIVQEPDNFVVKNFQIICILLGFHSESIICVG